MSPTPKVVECPVSPGEDPHVPAGTRVVRARAGMLEGGSLMGRFYQGPSSLPQVVFSHHSCPTREVWNQGTFCSTRNANVLSNEVATRRKQPLIFACLRWDGDHTSCFLQRPLHLVVPGQWSAAWNRHHAHPAWDHCQSGCIMLSRRASRRYSGSLGVVKVSMGDPFRYSSFGHAPGRSVGHVHENSGVSHKHIRCWGLAVASVERWSFSGHTWKARPGSALLAELALLEVGFLCV